MIKIKHLKVPKLKLNKFQNLGTKDLLKVELLILFLLYTKI